MATTTTRQLKWPHSETECSNIFVREVKGDSPGPVLVLIGGEHGIELTGPAGIDLVCREISQRSFRGTVLAVPAISPPNIRWRNHTHGQPHGKGYTFEMPYNTYAKWPGRADGDPAERLCHLVWTQIVSRADLLLNFHCWHSLSASCFFTKESVTPMGEVARSFGVPFIEPEDKADPRLLHGCLLLQGRPAAIIEMQGQWQVHAALMKRVRQGIINTMIVLGMIDDEPLLVPLHRYLMDGTEHIVKAPHPGLFIPLKMQEEPVRRGELLGYLLDIENGDRAEIRSPSDGATWLISRMGTASDVQLTGLHAYADAGDILALIKGVRS